MFCACGVSEGCCLSLYGLSQCICGLKKPVVALAMGFSFS